MPFNVTAMRTRTKRVTAEYDGETFDVWYRPGAITPRALQQFAQNGDDNVATLVEALSLFVAEWDVIDGDGKRIPPEPSELAQYPVTFLSNVVTAIMADLNAPQPSANERSTVPLDPVG